MPKSIKNETNSPKKQHDKSVEKAGMAWNNEEVNQMLMFLLERSEVKMTKFDAELIGKLLNRTPKSITVYHDKLRKKNREILNKAKVSTSKINKAPLSSDEEDGNESNSSVVKKNE